MLEKRSGTMKRECFAPRDVSRHPRPRARPQPWLRPCAAGSRKQGARLGAWRCRGNLISKGTARKRGSTKKITHERSLLKLVGSSA